MKDLFALANSVSTDLPESIRREKICDLILQELRTLTGAELRNYLTDFSFDMILPGTRLEIKFPMGTPIFDSAASEHKEVEREPYSSRRSSVGKGKPEIRKMSETENRVAALEQQISEQDERIANHEADIQNLIMAIKLINKTVNRWR